MTVDQETFQTVNRKSYTWPTPVPLTPRPAQPPITTKPNNFYVAKLVEPYCHCDYHLYEPQMGKYKLLADKEKELWKELSILSKEMAILAGDILDHPCDNYDEKMKTIYQTDYNKKGLEAKEYRKLVSAIESPVDVPFEGPKRGIGRGYLDPMKFRTRAIIRPTIDVCPPVILTQTPQTVSAWFVPSTGRSEYQDSISKTGLSIFKASQQYAEPLPSSRRRYGDIECL